MIILVSGVPASGKSYFAHTLGQELNIPVLSSDVIRDQLGLRGKYTSEAKHLIYERMLEQTVATLQTHRAVIVDATFSRKPYRGLFYGLAATQKCPLFFFLIQAEEGTIQERMKQKRKYSEATFEVYEKIKDEFESIEHRHLTIDSDQGPIEEMIQKAKTFIQLQSEKATYG